VHDAIANAPGGAGWLTTIQSAAATATAGRGLVIALVAAGLSAAVGLSVLVARCAKPALALATAIALFYFFVGEGVGGVLTGSGTDPNTGPLLIMLAISLYPLHRSGPALTWRHRRTREPSGSPGPMPSALTGSAAGAAPTPALVGPVDARGVVAGTLPGPVAGSAGPAR
jgi:hypothetical protein